LQHLPTDQEKEHYNIVKKIHAARLYLIFAYRYAWRLNHCINEKPIDFTAEILPWFYYMQQFANNEKDLPTQFFYEAAQAAFQLTRNLNK
jgi:hypothetical protein